MDQDKIGKLIAKLRKEKGLTQRELGDKVGVGFKAVSKWERGITCPDISIINELSKILGITSDELLTGELSKERNVSNKPSKKVNKRLLVIIASIAFISLFGIIIYKIYNDKVEVYELASVSNDYYVEGKVIFRNNKIGIYVNKLDFYDKNFSKTIINNYTYKINYEDINLVNYGYMPTANQDLPVMNVRQFSENFMINYEGEININKSSMIENGLTLEILFLDASRNSIQKDIILTLNKSK